MAQTLGGDAILTLEARFHLRWTEPYDECATIQTALSINSMYDPYIPTILGCGCAVCCGVPKVKTVPVPAMASTVGEDGMATHESRAVPGASGCP